MRNTKKKPTEFKPNGWVCLWFNGCNPEVFPVMKGDLGLNSLWVWFQLSDRPNHSGGVNLEWLIGRPDKNIDSTVVPENHVFGTREEAVAYLKVIAERKIARIRQQIKSLVGDHE